MQYPTCTGVRIRDIVGAHVLFYAVLLGQLPIVVQRLNPGEREAIQPETVFVWEERDAQTEATGAGISRWTDGRRWGPSRVREDFLIYYEKLPEFDANPELAQAILASRLVKQTYSAFVKTPDGCRKWHLVAYDSVETLHSVQNVHLVPALAPFVYRVPPGVFATARQVKNHARGEPLQDASGRADGGILYSGVPPDGPSALRKRTPPTAHPPGQSVPEGGQAPPDALDAPADASSLSAHLPDVHQAQSSTLTRGPASHDLAPLIFLRTSPYPPRHPIDNLNLRSLDCMVRIL